jgi:hypothetical protein
MSGDSDTDDARARRRELARMRQEKRRAAEACGIGTVPVRTHLRRLRDFLVATGFLEKSADAKPKTLALATAELVALIVGDENENVTRDATRMAAFPDQAYLVLRNGKWTIE